jgi:hypothetical protein
VCDFYSGKITLCVRQNDGAAKSSATLFAECGIVLEGWLARAELRPRTSKQVRTEKISRQCNITQFQRRHYKARPDGRASCYPITRYHVTLQTTSAA